MKSSTPGAVKVVSMRFYRPTRSIRLLQTDRTIYSNILQYTTNSSIYSTRCRLDFHRLPAGSGLWSSPKRDGGWVWAHFPEQRLVIEPTLDGQAPKTRVTGSQESTKDKYPTPVRCYIPCSLSHNPIQAHFTTWSIFFYLFHYFLFILFITFLCESFVITTKKPATLRRLPSWKFISVYQTTFKRDELR